VRLLQDEPIDYILKADRKFLLISGVLSWTDTRLRGDKNTRYFFY